MYWNLNLSRGVLAKEYVYSQIFYHVYTWFWDYISVLTEYKDQNF